MPLLKKEGHYQPFVGDVTKNEIDILLNDLEITILALEEHKTLPSNNTWKLLNEMFFSHRPEVELKVCGFHLRPMDLTFTGILDNVCHFYADALDDARGYENIAGMGRLKTLSVGFLNLQSFEFLEGVTDRLESLFVGSTLSAKPSLLPLKRFKYLKRLFLEKHVKHIEVLSDLVHLRDLTLHSITLPNLNILKPLKRLQSLVMELGSLMDISSLKGNSKIASVEFSRVRGLSDLNPLSSLTSLKTLHLESLPGVRSIPSLSGLKKLKEFSIINLTGVEDFGFLYSLPSLEALRFVQGEKGHNYETVELNRLMRIKGLKGAFIGFNSARMNRECEDLMKKMGIDEL